MEVGRISARLDAIFDDRGFDRFERALSSARGETRRPIEADLRADSTKAEREVSGFRRVMDRLRSDTRRPIEAEVRADVDSRSFDKAERAMKDVDKTAGRLRGGLGRLAGGAAAIGGGAAVAGFGAFAKAGIDAATDINESISKLNTVLGEEATKTITDFAETAATELGLSKQAALEASGSFAAFFDLMGKSKEDSAAMSVEMTKLAADMASFNNSTPEEALIALQAGLRGEAEPLRRFNVLLDDATLRQAAVREGLVKTTNEALTPQQKALAAHAVIMEQTSKQQGDFERTSGGLANQQRILRAQFSNVTAELGGKLLPIALKVAKGLNSFFGIFKSGGKDTDGIRSKLSMLRAPVNAVGNVFRSVFGFVKRIIADNRDNIDRFADNGRKAFRTVSDFVRDVGATFKRVFGGGSGIGADVRGAIRVILGFASRVQEVVINIARKILPVLTKAFEGVLTIVRGVIRVVTGLIRGDFGKAWDGAKDIVRGAVKTIGAILGGAGGFILNALQKGFSAGLKFIGGLPGRFLKIGRDIVSAIGRGLAGLPGKLGSALGSVGSFLSNVGRGIADWINDNTPFGDKIKVGPVSVTLPALAEGGKVGPGFGGFKAFIAGEGRLPEWVISQEGDRSKNVAWAREALETLTGKRVALHRGGKGKPIKQLPAPKSRVKENAGIIRSVKRGSKGLGSFERDIQDMERLYGQIDRSYGISDEVIYQEDAEGNVYVDEAARKKREEEVTGLRAQREGIRNKIQAYITAIQKAIAAYQAAIVRLDRLIAAAKGKARSKERSKYVGERKAYAARIGELKEVAHDLGFDLGDADLDLQELDAELSTLTPAYTASQAAQQNGSNSSDGGGGGTTPPSALEIATVAAEQLQAFNTNRADLFANFGSNFIASGGTLAGEGGLRFFGADAGGSGALAGVERGDTNINITQHYASGPDDPLAYSRGLQFELGNVF